MAGSQADETDWANMTNKELHDKFQQMMSGQVQDVLNRFEEAMEKIDGIQKAFETKLDNKLMNCSCIFHNHHPMHLSHLCNNNNYAPFRISMDEHNVFLLSQDNILVPLLLLLVLLWLLLLRRLRRMTIMQAIMRMRLIKIRTTCSHQHHHHQVDLRHNIAMVGLRHHLRYEIMTIFLN